MSLTTLVIGYGSIGKRHVDMLSKIDSVNDVVVLSHQSDLPYETLTSLNGIPDLNPDYIVIASHTALHHEQLTFLEENLLGKKILVEKPLFDSSKDLRVKNNHVFVGYNLRFHPLLQRIKKIISGKNLWNIQVFCGSYLPDWRFGRDYRQTSSAKKETGGGVLLDLSHELDYVQWLAGTISLEYVKSEKVSDLEIETDDLLLLSGKTVSDAHVHICLNYFSRRPTRQILIDGEGFSIQADLISNYLSVHELNEQTEFSCSEVQRNDSYLAQHNAVFGGDLSNICSYREGLETMRLIDRIRLMSPL
jgi:predicted dehydrogenase